MTAKLLPRDVAALVLVKLVALAVIWWLFFSPSHRPVVDAQARLLGPAAPSAPHR